MLNNAMRKYAIRNSKLPVITHTQRYACSQTDTQNSNKELNNKI